MLVLKRPAVVAAMLAVAITTASAQQPATAPGQPKVRVGAVGSLMYLPFYVALENGFFEKHGVAIDLINLGNTIPALVSGEIDLALNGSDSAVIAAVRGKPTPAVVMMQQRNSMSLTSTTALGSTSDGKGYPEKLWALKGKTIAILSRGSGAEVFVKQMMNGAGMEEGRDYNMVVIGSPGSIIAALKANQVDAANLWSPFQEQAWIEKAGAPMIREVQEGPPGRRLAAGISVHANPDFLKKNADVARRFVAAMVEADEFTRNIQANKERLIDIAVKYTGVQNREVLALAMPTISSLAYPGVDCNAWDETAKGLLSVNSVPSVPKCDEMAALEVAPKAPTGPPR